MLDFWVFFSFAALHYLPDCPAVLSYFYLLLNKKHQSKEITVTRESLMWTNLWVGWRHWRVRLQGGRRRRRLRFDLEHWTQTTWRRTQKNWLNVQNCAKIIFDLKNSTYTFPQVKVLLLSFHFLSLNCFLKCKNKKTKMETDVKDVKQAVCRKSLMNQTWHLFQLKTPDKHKTNISWARIKY